MDNEIQKLQPQKAIVMGGHEEEEVISHHFLRKERDESFRRIFNLKMLKRTLKNSFYSKYSF